MWPSVSVTVASIPVPCLPVLSLPFPTREWGGSTVVFPGRASVLETTLAGREPDTSYRDILGLSLHCQSFGQHLC